MKAAALTNMSLIRSQISYYLTYCQTPLQLADPTQLKLVGVGVDFVFPQEGRKEEGMNPHLASTRGNDPLCLKLVDCLVYVWKVFGKCLEGVWWMSGECRKGVWKVLMVYLNGILGVLIYLRGKSGLVKLG